MNSITKISFSNLLELLYRFNEHIKVKLQETNKCLNKIICLCTEGYQQPDVDCVFRSIVNVRPTRIRLLNTRISSGPKISTALLKRQIYWGSYQIDIN